MAADGAAGRAAVRGAIGLLLVAGVVAAVVLLVRPGDGPGAGAGASTVDDPLLADVRAFAERRPVRVGWFPDAAPVSVWDGDELVGGYGVEAWNLAAIKLGFQVEHVLLDDVTSVVDALQDGTIDIAGGHGQRADLRAFAAPTEPLAWERITFIGAPSQVAAGTADLAGRTVTTIDGSQLEIALGLRFPEATYVPSASIEEGLADTADGDIDLYLAPLGVAGFTMRRDALDLVPVGEEMEVAPISGWAVADGPAIALARAGRAALTDDDISLITVRWSGFDLGRPGRSSPTWLPRALMIALALAVTLGLFSLVLRRRVRAATAEVTESNRQLAALNAELEDRVEARTSELAATVERLRRSNLALAEFAQTVAHDLRGPVTAIHGLSTVLGSIDLDSDRHEEVLSAITASSGRLGAMIQTLLDDAARAGAHDPALTGPEFAAWLREILGPEVEAVDATLRMEVPAGELSVDTAILRRIALNLVGNALKYATNPQGTQIAVRLEMPDPETWSLTVDDNGPGIPAELHDRIFEAGFRLSDDTRGRGLGLADTREVVERAGGRVDVASSPLGGARFTVRLPAQPSVPTQPLADRPVEAV